jgi:hypothetical protein
MKTIKIATFKGLNRNTFTFTGTDAEIEAYCKQLEAEGRTITFRWDA